MTTLADVKIGDRVKTACGTGVVIATEYKAHAYRQCVIGYEDWDRTLGSNAHNHRHIDAFWKEVHPFSQSPECKYHIYHELYVECEILSQAAPKELPIVKLETAKIGERVSVRLHQSDPNTQSYLSDAGTKIEATVICIGIEDNMLLG